MAAMTVALTEFSNNANSRTSTTSGHTAVKPKVVIEKRKVPEGNQVMAEYDFKVVHATTDSAGTILKEKVSFQGTCRYPLGGQTADRDAALVVFRAIIAGDEYANSVSTQGWL